jgi:hypothetical protein
MSFAGASVACLVHCSGNEPRMVHLPASSEVQAHGQCPAADTLLQKWVQVKTHEPLVGHCPQSIRYSHRSGVLLGYNLTLEQGTLKLILGATGLFKDGKRTFSHSHSAGWSSVIDGCSTVAPNPAARLTPQPAHAIYGLWCWSCIITAEVDLSFCVEYTSPELDCRQCCERQVLQPQCGRGDGREDEALALRREACGRTGEDRFRVLAVVVITLW